ncbi:MAG: 2-hydroxy-3-oxopropionate reductase [Thermomicrobiales bacterium]|nr:MAG: 2-hydroxy-3-oxopropionate reductase [Thermomicrobiales bacterium]
MAETVGFIGLGIMGKPMARHLASAGYDVVIHTLNRETVTTFTTESDKFIAASNPKEVAARAKIVITMLPDSPQVSEVVLGTNGLIESMGEGSLHIDMSTIAPATAIEVSTALAGAGARALDAPVSGGEAGAVNAALSIMVGGAAEDVERAMPLFEKMGKTIVHVGQSGAGQVVKACNQVMVAINYAAMSEALVLGAKAGVDPEKILQVLGGGLANSRVMELKGKNVINRQFAPGFRVDLHRKDLNIAMNAGKTTGVPLPVTALVQQLFEALSVAGRGGLDHSSLVTIYEDLANFQIGEPSA